MPHYTVTWTHSIECESTEQAVHAAFREMLKAGVGNGLNNSLIVSDDQTGNSVEMTILDGVVKVEPMLVAQLLGFRHIIWAGQARK